MADSMANAVGESNVLGILFKNKMPCSEEDYSEQGFDVK